MNAAAVLKTYSDIEVDLWAINEFGDEVYDAAVQIFGTGAGRALEAHYYVGAFESGAAYLIELDDRYCDSFNYERSFAYRVELGEFRTVPTADKPGMEGVHIFYAPGKLI